MPRISYIDKRLSESTLAVIGIANRIIAEYQAQGFRLTLRQLYYQFVARDLLPNTQRSYKRLGSIVNDGRLVGLIDWLAIEDRTRSLRRLTTWNSVSEIARAASETFKVDPWEKQDYRPEVWIEKEALAGVIEPVCDRLRVPMFACRGYTSQSEMWSAGAGRFSSSIRTPIIFHLGDHDPSGIDMTRDIEDRVALFTGETVEVRRLALNYDQVREYNPPPNPAKTTDARFAGYVSRFGSESWELDALDPATLDQLITSAVQELIDEDLWQVELEREESGRRRLREFAEKVEDARE